MRQWLIISALSAAVAAAWLGAVGFARLRLPSDRLHCVSFVNTVSGLTLILAAALSDGISIRVGKIIVIVGLNLVCGAAASHVIGRALLERRRGRA